MRRNQAARRAVIQMGSCRVRLRLVSSCPLRTQKTPHLFYLRSGSSFIIREAPPSILATGYWPTRASSKIPLKFRTHLLSPPVGTCSSTRSTRRYRSIMTRTPSSWQTSPGRPSMPSAIPRPQKAKPMQKQRTRRPAHLPGAGPSPHRESPTSLRLRSRAR